MTFIALFYLVAVFMLGAILGSFLNVVAVDSMNVYMKEKLYERSEWTFIKGKFTDKIFWKHLITHRSSCDTCSTILTPKELVPVVSYLYQRGKCKTCEVSFAPQHLYIELIAGVLFTGVFYAIFNSYAVLSPLFVFEVFYFFIFFSLALLLMIFDYEHMIVPNFLVYPMMVMAFVANILPFKSLQNISGTELVLSACALAAPLFLVWMLSKGKGMGFADWKISFVMGALLGLNLGLSALVMSFWVGALISLAMIGYQNYLKPQQELKEGEIREGEELSLKSAIPFGPFLVIGLWLAYVTGVVIIGIL